MNKSKYFFSLLTIMLISVAGFSQNKQQQKNIIAHYNLQKIQTLKQHYAKVMRIQKNEAYEYALAHGIPVVKDLKNGNKSYLIRIDEMGNLIYRKTTNLGAAQTTSTDALYPGGSLGLQLTGDGMFVGEWDGGAVRGTHELLTGKVTHEDSPGGLSDHSTHVAGTLVGKALTTSPGILARGMAYEADLHAYDWISDLSEMVTAAGSNGMLVSNHSYGLDLSQFSSSEVGKYLGHYGSYSSNLDNILYNLPYYTVVFAAGNDRDVGYSSDGYDILGADATTAKNDIVVAAVKKVLDYTGPSSVEMSSFSSWGPTSDRRIKPDISGDGVGVFSSTAESDDSYASFSGTSMATPNVAGSLLLLQQLSSDVNNGQFLRAATIKAIIIETARECGTTPGPDARFGWGLLNMEGAAQLILGDSENGSDYFYDELTLQNGGTYTKPITSTGNEEIKITIAWTDPAGNPQAVNGSNSVLVNDLDMRITDSQGNTYYPWQLHPYSNNAGAINTGDNNLDNVEQVIVPSPTEGQEFTLTITHKGSLQGDEQDYSIAGMGVINDEGVATHQLNDVTIFPNPADGQFTLSFQEPSNRVGVSIYDINGKRVLNKDFSGSVNFTQTIKIPNLSSGIYFVKINADGRRATKKLIVK